MEFFEKIFRNHPEIIIQRHVPLRKYTTLRVGGPARYFAEPATEEQLSALASEAREGGIPLLLMGNGSNLLVRDGGFPGLAVHLGKAFSRIDRLPEGLFAQAGASLGGLARAAWEAGLTGLEFAQGIPGTVGGGVYMNAGAYGGELGQWIRSVRVLSPDGLIRSRSREEMRFSYRHSSAMDEKEIVLGALFALRPGDREEIHRAMQDYAGRRKEKQPLEYPSAGSFFKRPQGHFAGALIEQAGLKGCSIGGAQVSQKHAGFLINTGGASAKDFLDLMEKVQRTVMEASGVWLEPEVRIVGEDR